MFKGYGVDDWREGFRVLDVIVDELTTTKPFDDEQILYPEPDEDEEAVDEFDENEGS